MANGSPQAVPPLGTVPLRNYLRGFGVPDNMIQFDPDTQTVRVGNQMIRPEANLQGQTFASPDVLQRAIQAVNAHLMPAIQPPTQPTQPVFAPSTDPMRGLPSSGASLMGNLAAASQALPVFQSLLQGMQDVPLTPGAIDIFGSQTGYLPGGRPTLARSQLEETIRANRAREGLQAQQIALARSAEERAQQEQQATLQFISDIRNGVEYGLALAGAVARGGNATQLANLAGPLIDDPTKDAAILRGISERYGTDENNAVFISNIVSAPNRSAATNEYLRSRSVLLSQNAESLPLELQAALTDPNLPEEQLQLMIDDYLASIGYDTRRWRMAIEDAFPIESSQGELQAADAFSVGPAQRPNLWESAFFRQTLSQQPY